MSFVIKKTYVPLYSLFALLSALVSAYQPCLRRIHRFKGWMSKAAFTKRDDSIRHVTATIVHVQLIIAIILYSISPLIRYFFAEYKDAVHDRSIRYFGMEHSLMMLIAVILITIGSMIAKRKTADMEKFRTMALWYGVGLIIILVSIPWPFSPMASRPWLRML